MRKVILSPPPQGHHNPNRPGLDSSSPPSRRWLERNPVRAARARYGSGAVSSDFVVQPRGNASRALARTVGSSSIANELATVENLASHDHGGAGQLSRSRVKQSSSGCQSILRAYSAWPEGYTLVAIAWKRTLAIQPRFRLPGCHDCLFVVKTHGAIAPSL